MLYKFFCPSCDKQVDIEMKISEYKEDYSCDVCNVQLERDMSDCCTSFDVKVSGFCGKCGN